MHADGIAHQKFFLRYFDDSLNFSSCMGITEQ